MNPATARVLLPLTLLAGLAGCSPAGPDPVAGAGSPSPTPGTATASGVASTNPGVPSPTRTAAPATPTTSKAACPVGAATLQRVAGLGDTHRIDPDHIKCARQWATAGVIAVDPTMQGDGVLLFEYSSGAWKKVGEGSALECTPFGIPPEIGDQVGCHDMR
ncbi:hypothetical protein [Micromonospora sp. MH99]|uniref:hypothetical protein n=1 Tax=Micromonospora sp. MH99 TaxID=1945510 RepID=UPI001F30CAB9|nr:hypothetical protein [Micromonospora sp. MH99]MCF0091849.1 hypothetical protein [Micromonospora sp. MH99]